MTLDNQKTDLSSLPPISGSSLVTEESLALKNINYQGLDLGYTWSQKLNEVEIIIPLTKPAKSRDLTVNLTNQYIKVGFKGEDPILEGEFYSKIRPQQSTWSLEQSNLIVINLEKLQKFNWWECIIVGHPKINIKNLTPDTYLLPQLYSSNRAIVEEMMEDQRIKCQNKVGDTVENDPTYEASLKRFLKLHPELTENFS